PRNLHSFPTRRSSDLCASDVLGLEDRWDEALKSAEISWEMNARTPYGARSLGNSLVNLRRIREATERLSTAAEECQSFEVAHSRSEEHTSELQSRRDL